MVDVQYVLLLAFNFGSRKFNYMWLAQGLNRSLSVFNSTVREYVDAVVKAGECAQNVDHMGIAAHNSKTYCPPLRNFCKNFRRRVSKCQCRSAASVTHIYTSEKTSNSQWPNNTMIESSRSWKNSQKLLKFHYDSH